FVLPYFNRAVTRYKQIEVNDANKGTSISTELTITSGSKPVMGQLGAASALNQEPMENNPVFRYDVIIRDYDKVIALNPEFFYAYFNRGNIRCLQKDYRAAIKDYSEAIRINPDFAEAYFNRGLTQLYLGDTSKGVSDLSKAGELGMVNAYSIIKKMTE
ncbi:tetratricopeptide repeat protein, partial [Bacteroidales bacterium OttesenSCG-928-L03]|nr:tetratricopeptide repeat protein [Bacteroidales bacterium OttesenSCG-928-L03]